MPMRLSRLEALVICVDVDVDCTMYTCKQRENGCDATAVVMIGGKRMVCGGVRAKYICTTWGGRVGFSGARHGSRGV